MTKDNDDDWIEGLIAIGIGALAVYFFVKAISVSGNKDDIEVCPYCRAQIKKWAIECPNCRRKIRGPL